MAMQIDITRDNSKEFIRLLGEKLETALEQCGIRAEELAVGKCPVDTGLLRNSITYALDGQSPEKGSYKADRGEKTGSYKGRAPKEEKGVRSVVIGTNVEYGPFVEVGSSKRKPKPFLKPAVQNHKKDYQEIIQRNLKGGA